MKHTHTRTRTHIRENSGILCIEERNVNKNFYLTQKTFLIDKA